MKWLPEAVCPLLSPNSYGRWQTTLERRFCSCLYILYQHTCFCSHHIKCDDSMPLCWAVARYVERVVWSSCTHHIPASIIIMVWAAFHFFSVLPWETRQLVVVSLLLIRLIFLCLYYILALYSPSYKERRIVYRGSYRPLNISTLCKAEKSGAR